MQQLLSHPTFQEYTWTKELPTLIQTLGSKNEEEVTVARKSLVFNFTSIFERLKNSENDAKLLGDLLDEVNKLLFPIYASDAVQKGSLISEMIDLTHLINDGRRNETSWLSPLYRLFSTIYDHVDPIIEMIKLEEDPKFIQGCCYIMGHIKMQDTVSNNKIIQTMTDLWHKHDNDQIRACAIMSLYVLEDRFSDRNLRLAALTSAQRLLNEGDPSLAKLAAAIFIASRSHSKSSQVVASILADYIKYQKDYDQIWSSIPFKHLSLSQTISVSVPKLSPVIDWFTDRAIIHLQHLDETEESMTSLIKCIDLFFEAVLQDQIEPGMNIADLNPYVVRALEQLVKMNKIWNIEGFDKKLGNYGLSSHNTKELLIQFIADKTVHEEKKFPTFEGLDEIDWSELDDAYGPATDVPEAIRKLASHDMMKREEGFSLMYSNVVHQGSLFPVAEYVVPFLMEILECASTPKRALLSLIRDMLYNHPDEYLYKKEYFSLDEVFPDQDEYSDLVQAVHEHVTEDIDVLFNIILDDPDCAGVVSEILPFLEQAADLGAVPILKQAIAKHVDWTVKGELLWSLSFLYPKIASRDECLDYFMDYWKQAEAEGTLNLPMAAGLARFYFEDEAAPKFLVDKLVAEYLANEEDQHAIKTLGMLGSELAFPPLLQKLHEVGPRGSWPLVETLLAIAFKFERHTGKPIIGSALKPHQLALLQTIVDRNMECLYLLSNYQLPTTMEGLARLVEDATANKEIDSDM